jgi:hypothetical protein
LHLAVRQGAERLFQFGQEFGRIEKVHNLLLSQRQDLVRVLPDLEGGLHFTTFAPWAQNCPNP